MRDIVDKAMNVKDNEIATFVNKLRDIAVEFHSTEQLRDRISSEVQSFLISIDSEELSKIYNRAVASIEKTSS